MRCYDTLISDVSHRLVGGLNHCQWIVSELSVDCQWIVSRLPDCQLIVSELSVD